MKSWSIFNFFWSGGVDEYKMEKSPIRCLFSWVETGLNLTYNVRGTWLKKISHQTVIKQIIAPCIGCNTCAIGREQPRHQSFFHLEFC